LEGEKKDQEKHATEVAQLRDEVTGLQVKVGDVYDADFSLSLDQIKVIAPVFDVSRLSPQLEVNHGRLVPPEPYVNQENDPA
jgi:hypothetical protein